MRVSKSPSLRYSEQKKIAYVLSIVQEAKEKTEDVIKAAKDLKKSMMKHLFTYGPVSLEEAENIPLKETEIGLVPEEWEVVKVGEIFEKIEKNERKINVKEREIYKQITVKLYAKGVILREVTKGKKIKVKTNIV